MTPTQWFDDLSSVVHKMHWLVVTKYKFAHQLSKDLTTIIGRGDDSFMQDHSQESFSLQD